MSDFQLLHFRMEAGDPTDPAATWYVDHQTKAMSLKPLAGVVFLDGDGKATDVAPRSIELPTGVADRYAWIEQVGRKSVARPGGPPEDEWRSTHTFPHASDLILHMRTGDYHYEVVEQPDVYDGDDGREARYFYRANLVGVDDATGPPTGEAWNLVRDDPREFVKVEG